jgi:hypothetical protein
MSCVELSRKLLRIGVSLRNRRTSRTAALGAVAALFVLVSMERAAKAVVVYSQPLGINVQPTDDPRWNATVQWQTTNGAGTIIGSQYFLTAQHLFPSVGDTISLTTVNGPGSVTTTQTYTTTAVTNIPGTDLAVWKVSGTFPSSSIVPLYNQPAGSELGKQISMLGYGIDQQGAPVVTGATQNGWFWSGNHGTSGEKNFGTNTVAAITHDGVGGSPTLVHVFSNTGGSQGVIAPGDSGGGQFINVGGTQYLAGINYEVLLFYSFDPSTSTYTLDHAAIYNTAGLYVTDGVNFYLASSLGITAQYGYATEVAPWVSQIQAAEAAMVPEPGTGILLVLGSLGVVAAGRLRRR